MVGLQSKPSIFARPWARAVPVYLGPRRCAQQSRRQSLSSCFHGAPWAVRQDVPAVPCPPQPSSSPAASDSRSTWRSALESPYRRQIVARSAQELWRDPVTHRDWPGLPGSRNRSTSVLICIGLKARVADRNENPAQPPIFEEDDLMGVHQLALWSWY